MKKERVEFTILRYLGRPPSLFDDEAIAAVAKILEKAGSKFDWDKFTEYATFHKLSQTLFPNMKTYGKSVNGKRKRVKEEEEKENRLSEVGGRESSSSASPAKLETTTNEQRITNNKNTSGANPSFTPHPLPFTIPTSVVSHFRGIFFANAARNEFLAQELVKINKLMADNGIEMLNWKGPALALQAYGDLSLRQFKDLDTLVKHEDLEKAKAILLANGFEDITPQNRLPEYSEGRGYEFFNTKKRYELELEYSIFLARSVLDYDYDGMFDRPSSILVDKDQIKTLSIEDNLLFTSFHGTKHLWFRTRWLADILGKFELNKYEILSTIDNFEQKQLIAFCIYTALKEFGLEKSENAAQVYKLLLKYEIKDFKHFENIINNRILQHNDKDTPLNHYQKATIIANVISGDQNKKKYSNDIKYFTFWRRIRNRIRPNQLDFDLLELPKPLYPLYYIVRPVRVFKRYYKKIKR